jgi:uncharacterized MAPEG superfamily protein
MAEVESFAAYGHTLVAIAGVALVQLVLSPVSALAKWREGVVPGASPAPDYASRTYRAHRAYANLTESMGLFVGLCVAAMLAGVAPFWVNLLASVYLVARLVMAVVHVKGWGKPDIGPRSFAYVTGNLMCVGLALMVIAKVVFS